MVTPTEQLVAQHTNTNTHIVKLDLVLEVLNTAD